MKGAHKQWSGPIGKDRWTSMWSRTHVTCHPDRSGRTLRRPSAGGGVRGRVVAGGSTPGGGGRHVERAGRLLLPPKRRASSRWQCLSWSRARPVRQRTSSLRTPIGLQRRSTRPAAAIAGPATAALSVRSLPAALRRLTGSDGLSPPQMAFGACTLADPDGSQTWVLLHIDAHSHIGPDGSTPVR